MDPGATHITLFVMERKLREHKAALVILAVLIALALALAVIGQTVTSTGVERVVTTVGTHARKIAILEAQQTELAITTTRRLDSMHVTLAEVMYPPSEFAEAQDLFRAERYAEAEAAYHSFLLRNPSSRLAEKALYNGAVAAAMRNNCNTAGSYVKRLHDQFPTSPLRGASIDLVSQCHKLRLNQKPN